MLTIRPVDKCQNEKYRYPFSRSVTLAKTKRGESSYGSTARQLVVGFDSRLNEFALSQSHDVPLNFAAIIILIKKK